MSARRIGLAALVAVLVALVACTANDALVTNAPARQPANATDTAVVNAADMDVVGQRAAHTASVLADGRLLVAGGCVVDGCSAGSDSTFVIEADGTTVRIGPSMSVARDSHTATVVAGRVVIAGGFPGEGAAPTSVVEVFDPTTSTLELIGDLHTPRGGHAAAPLGGSKVLVVGGWVAPRTYTDSVEVIDASARTIESTESLPWAADALDAAPLNDGRILVTGGLVAAEQATARAAVFDPTTRRWTEIDPMGTPRAKHASVVLPDGRVLVIGGTTDDRDMLATTEVFDPTTNRFEPGPTLLEGRYKIAGGLVVLGDGRVVVGGGGQSVEVIDVELRRSSRVSTDARRRSFATVSPLAKGRVLVIGGYDDRVGLVGKPFIVRVG